MSVATIELAETFVRAYPAAAARRAEGAPPAEVADLLAKLAPEDAAALLARLIPLAAAPALAAMPPSSAAGLAERLGPLRLTLLLRRMQTAEVSALVAALPEKTQKLVRRLLGYRPDQAGSRMDPSAPAVSDDASAQHALDMVRRSPESALNYVYVVNERQQLIGVVSMRELMLTNPETPVASIMTKNPQRLRADEPVQGVLVHPGWRRTHALPVVDARDCFLGVVRYSAFRTLEAELGQARSGPVAGQTAEALAELLWIGTAAIARMTRAALLGSHIQEEEEESK